MDENRTDPREELGIALAAQSKRSKKPKIVKKPDGSWRAPSLSRGGKHEIWFRPDPDCCGENAGTVTVPTIGSIATSARTFTPSKRCFGTIQGLRH